MFKPVSTISLSLASRSLDPLDRAAIAFLTLPMVIFVAGWFQWWVAGPLLICLALALRPLAAPLAAGGPRVPITRVQVTVAVLAGCTWTVLGGTDHWVFANPDWFTRDAVLHDLIVSQWPVGYGLLDGGERILRAPLAYYLPAALVGKCAGLAVGQAAMSLWTALGASLFLSQILSVTTARLPAALLIVTVVVFFSGLDIVGNLLDDGPRFRSDWNITTHLEWWAGKFQYSSMTTQLFWVPNHALPGWLAVGLICRNAEERLLNSLWPILVVCIALWSPLTAIGIVPFVILQMARQIGLGTFRDALRLNRLAPAVLVGLPVAAYLVLDTQGVPHGISTGNASGGVATALLLHAQFYLLEVGFIGAATIAIWRSTEMFVALSFLAILPFAHIGANNDLVMRASIPSLAILAIGASRALLTLPDAAHGLRKKALVGALLLIGAVTPIAEFARAVMLPVWPINLRATLIDASCGTYSPSYVGLLRFEVIGRLLRRPHRLTGSSLPIKTCVNPAVEIMWRKSPP
jgi:hypothetical protein